MWGKIFTISSICLIISGAVIALCFNQYSLSAGIAGGGALAWFGGGGSMFFFADKKSADKDLKKVFKIKDEEDRD